MKPPKSKKPPAIEPPDLGRESSLEKISPTRSLADGPFSELLVENVDWSDQAASSADFNFSLLRQARLTKTRLKSAQFRDLRFIGCDVSVGDWIGASIRRVEFLTTRMTGLNLSETTIKDVVFRDCPLSYAVFQFAKLERCRFEDCDLVDVTFQGASFSDVTFRNCNLTSAQFSDARLNQVDLRGSRLDGLQMALDQLREVTIDPGQTDVIASLTRVTVLPLEE